MKISALISELKWCLDCQGDREVYYLSRRFKGTDDETVLYEQINQVHATVVKVDKEYFPHPDEPITLVGCFGGEFLSEKLIKLNRFGRFIKRLIVKK